MIKQIKKILHPLKRKVIYMYKSIKKIIFPPTIIKINNQFWGNKPLVSVIIPCFNYGQYINEAINSVLKQTFQNFEIIVVNDGSTDVNTIKVLSNIKHPQIKIINQSNKKLPAARNNGIKEAQGKYICCLDADDKLKPTYLEKCISKMEHENLDICYSYLKEFEEGNMLWQAGDFNIKILMKGNCVPVSAVYKKSVWENIGGYDEKFTSGYEDWEFWLRFAKTGALGGRIHEPLFLYRKHGKSMINFAKNQHDLIFQKIKTKNKDIYSNINMIKKIQKSQNVIYRVINRDINLYM